MIFSSKVILFGEYSVLKGGKGLAFPFEKFSGVLKPVRDEQYAHVFEELFDFIKGYSVLSNDLDLEKFKQDLEEGISFDSSIPIGKGVGSSGALCAALYARYSKSFERKDHYTNEELRELQSKMALMESYYHGSSSGIDCLISLVNRPVLIESRTEVKILEDFDTSDFYLYDGITARKTSYLVQEFLTKYRESKEYQAKFAEFRDLSNQGISDTLKGNNIADLMEKISYSQLEIFKSMIPDSVLSVWLEGLKSKEYFMKLCGAGGGGFFLIYAPKHNLDLEVIQI